MILHSEDVIREYTEKGYWGVKTLLDYFYENVEKNSDREALVDPPNKEELVGLKPERISYEKLGKIVDAVAAELQESGVLKDSIVLVQLPNTWELAMLYLAIARAGGIISPMPMQWRQRELKYLAKLTNAKHYITVVDRKKDMIKSGGENVSSREVEEVIYKDSRVSEVAVIGLPHEKWIEAVTAIVVPKRGEKITEEEIIQLCRQNLAPFKVPKKVVFVEELPKTPTGKILKRELRKMYSNLYGG